MSFRLSIEPVQSNHASGSCIVDGQCQDSVYQGRQFELIAKSRFSWQSGFDMSNMLTIQEASALAGVSEKTIRRWLEGIKNKSDHPDRDQISPSYSESEEIRRKKKRLVWKIDQKFVRRHFLNDGARKSSQTKSSMKTGESEIIFLRRQVESIRAELDEERDHNRAMQSENNERQREMNHLLKGFQLQLETGKTATSDDAVNAVTVTSSPVNEPSQQSNEERQSELQDQTKRRWLNRWLKSGPAVRFDRDQNSIQFYVARGE